MSKGNIPLGEDLGQSAGEPAGGSPRRHATDNDVTRTVTRPPLARICT
jgi:hypothetical protein